MAESHDSLQAIMQLGGLNGSKGAVIYADTSTHYGYFAGFKTISTGAVIDLYGGVTDTGGVLPSTFLPSGFVFPCYSTMIALTSGTVMVFYS